jgi:signal transduction histidine kinase
MGKGKVLCVSADQALAAALGPLLKGHAYEVQAVPNAREAGVVLSGGDWAGVVLDGATVRGADRDALLAIQKQRSNFPLIVLDTPASLSPVEASALRRLGLPLPAGFADQVRACGKPVVFLVEQGVFASKAVQTALQDAGVQPVSLENTVGLVDILVRQAEFEQRQRETPKPKSGGFWSRLGSSSREEEAAPRLAKVIVAGFQGSPADAEAFDGRLRQTLPAAVCYLVSGIDAIAEAVKAVRANFPASIMRDNAAKIPGILADASQTVAARTGKPRVLIAENQKAVLEGYAQALVANGYEVTPVVDAEKVLAAIGQPGSYNLVALGLPMAFVPNSSLELAKRLRDADKDLAILLLVDPNPAPTATQAMSQASSLEVDEALLKPVTPGQLLRSVQKALERRFLMAEVKRLLAETEEQKRKLEQVNGFQTKFFSMVAHDVKNPLTAILGYSEVLGMRLKEPSEIKCASHIHSAAKTLNLLISDLVDLAAIESGKLRVTIGQLDLAQVIQEVRSRIDVVAAQRQIKYSVDVPPSLPALAGDPARLGQVIQNLCTNAIQYTKEGGSVWVKVDAGPDWVTVGVNDTGIGIKKEDIPRVWERFFQTAEAQAMRKAGFGLGLKISREIVQMHGGEMGIESEYGKGSRFFFTLPVQKGAPAAATAPAAPAAAAPAPAAPAGTVTLAPVPAAPAPPAAPVPAAPVTAAPRPAAPAPAAPAPAGTQTLGTFGKPLGGPIPK